MKTKDEQIKELEEFIEKQQNFISEYLNQIGVSNDPKDKDSLKLKIEQCYKTINEFKEQIQKVSSGGTLDSNTDSAKLIQPHSGTGDNVGRDKIGSQINQGDGSTYIEKQVNIHIQKDDNKNTENSISFFNVPIPKNPFFTGRKDILDKLHQGLHDQKEILVQSTPNEIALSGMGGVGKTQTAAEYAYRYKNDYSDVLWISSDGKELLRQNFGQLAKVFGSKEEKLNEQIIEVQAWLRNNKNWLLIFDNAETLDVLKEARSLVPTSGIGHILFTTRAQATADLDAVSVDCFDDNTGSVFLLRRSKIVKYEIPEESVQNKVSENDWKTSGTLVHEMGGLALAISQAGAYIEQTGCSIEWYYNLFQKDASRMLKERGYTHSADHPEAVYKTFLLAFERVKERSELAYDIMLDIALLHPDGISEKIYNDKDPFELDEALETLKDYSLIQRTPEKKLITVHRLVQVVIKETCDG